MPKALPKESVRTSSRSHVEERERLGRSPSFGIADSCLRNWLRAADVAECSRPGLSPVESEQLRELRRRIRLLEQQNEVMRRAAAYLSGGSTQNDVPAGP